MAYDEPSAGRMRKLLARRQGVVEKQMFGGVGFLLRGNMCVGVWKEFLILRLGPEAGEAALEEPFTRPFDITGRAMQGWVMVYPEGFAEDADLADWVQRAVGFVKTLPKK